MAYNDNQNDPALPADKPIKRSSVNHLPKYFRSRYNRKFLSATFDQMIQPGVAEKVNGYYGRKVTNAYNAQDNYVGDVSKQREDYQFEPASIIKDTLGNTTYYKDYNDYVNQIGNFNGSNTNHAKLNAQEYYAWDPHIDWDKFVNFREYYWLPTGPQSVPVAGQTIDVVSTYTVTAQDNVDNRSYIFSPDGKTPNPTLKLYRGITYRFEVDAPGLPLVFRSKRVEDPTFNIIQDSSDATDKGIIEFRLDQSTPDVIYYMSDNDPGSSGVIEVYNIEEATKIDVDAEVVGKKTYKTGNGFELTNGMKIYFIGNVTPNTYSDGEYYVEGVGDSIKLIKEDSLDVPTTFTTNIVNPFDDGAFDRLPFGQSIGYPLTRDYVLINRSAIDGNLWSRYNRWFHREVIEKSAEINNQPVEVDQTNRASRPIIEFEAGIKLFDFGTKNKTDVDLIDIFTTDVRSTIEGATGYNIDSIDLSEGMRILFLGDKDERVYGKIFKVKFINFKNRTQIALLDETDTDPILNETVLVRQGDVYKGKMFYYNGTEWKNGQDKTNVNVSPLFDLCDKDGNSYGDKTVYDASNFTGNKLFSYKQGSGSNDTELGFPLSYRNITNSGDILFDFNLLGQTFTYQTNNNLVDVNSDITFLKKYLSIDEFVFETGYKKAKSLSTQKVERQYVYDGTQTEFSIDQYNESANLNDLWLRVYKNNEIQKLGQDYTTTQDVNNIKQIVFTKDLNVNDIILIKTKSATEKNDNGTYEFPINFERNPKNKNVTEFTLGEVNDHVSTIVEELDNFNGAFPGNSNLRDLGAVTVFGTRFVKHSGLINHSLYHLTNDESNVINSIKFSRKEYAKFKRRFIQVAETLGFEGDVKTHVDLILSEINKSKTETNPFFFSDMVPLGGAKELRYEIEDPNNTFFALSKVFDKNILDKRAVTVYLNGLQLTHGKDYTFNTEGFAVITATKSENDIVTIYEYENTNGSYVPATPTKLGLYPKFEPSYYIDDTVRSIKTPNNTTGAFKVYGVAGPNQRGSGKLGWFYPLYIDINEAKNRDVELGGSGGAHAHSFVGLNRTFFMPNSAANHGVQDNADLQEWTEGVGVIQGHDGSIIKGYSDFRDNLLLELEKRIYNNLKMSYDTNVFDLSDYIEGDVRNVDTPKVNVDKAMLSDFIDWTKIADTQYTNNNFVRSDSFSFNYQSMQSPSGKVLPGYWRQVYKVAYDTDRPHTHPWEMLGFTVKPTWWETNYGPSPYTGDNLVMWQDIEKGKIAEPNKVALYVEKYKRPNLTSHIPSGPDGELLSPLASGYAQGFTSQGIENNFKFGDGAPVESAWRRSSEYPFSLISSLILNTPSKMFATAFDRQRQVRNVAGILVYGDTGKQIELDKIVYPPSTNDSTQNYTSGFVNYIADYMFLDVTTSYADYKANVSNIQNNIAFKVGAFTEKAKFKLILDSRSPTNEGNVFVPNENYEIFLNTSTPIKTVAYSGVIVEKVAGGYTVRGYSNTSAKFQTHPVIKQQKDPIITIGGISEDFLKWADNKFYENGIIVEYQSSYYRVTESHTSTSTLDTDKTVKLAELPMNGGVRASFAKIYNKNIVQEVQYGTTYNTIQQVVDFMIGYGSWLEEQGFVFDNYEGNEAVVQDWKYSAKQFMFWTTQRWDNGTILTVSPAAQYLKFISNKSVVANVYETIYGYSLVKADGKKLNPEFLAVGRENPNEFYIQTRNTADGIYAITLPLVQKEHVVLLDNRTVFGDVIYDQEPGYRQERIKVAGYRTDDWNGSISVPGFFYDAAKIVQWEPWADYDIGAIVKYKEFYYSADQKIPGTETFIDKQWNRLTDKPFAGLYSNWDYKAIQFTDFYDLDSDNFDVEQQRLAQHLIGYQKRKYLENIINDDVSQYKFYQGMLQDKGTKNSLTKMFDALASADKDSLQFYEEWAIKDGQYGAVDAFQEVDYLLDENKFKLTPQPIELVQNIAPGDTDLVYKIPPFEVYQKTDDYNHAPFPTKYIEDSYVRNAGYVDLDDVRVISTTYDDIVNLTFEDLRQGDYVWVGTDNRSWSVYKYSNTTNAIISVTGGSDEFTLNLKETFRSISVNDVIGVFDVQDVDGFYKVKSVTGDKITLFTDTEIEDVEDCAGYITNFVKVRASDVDEANQIAQKNLQDGDILWIDKAADGKWAVLKNARDYSLSQTIENKNGDDSALHNFASSIAVNKRNTVLAVGLPDFDNGKVNVYNRASESNNYILIAELVPLPGAAMDKERFGASVDVSEDGKYIYVGSPHASKVKTRYQDEFITTINYLKNDIVKYDDSLWRASVGIQGAEASIDFQSFASVTQIRLALGLTDETDDAPVILASGNYPFTDTATDHVIVRGPFKQYEGSKVGDTISLKWNQRSHAYQNKNSIQDVAPFNGIYNPIVGTDFITGEHQILYKVDAVLYVDAATNVPIIGDVVETAGAIGTVAYKYNEQARVTIYVKDVNGVFPKEGSLFLDNGDFVGEYEKKLHNDASDYSSQWGGYWVIDVGLAYNTGPTETSLGDSGKGLIYEDFTPSGQSNENRRYFNILDVDDDSTVNSENTLGSYIRTLSNQGAPGALGITSPILSDLYVVKAPKVLTDATSPGDKINFYIDQLPRWSDNSYIDITNVGLTTTITNKEQTVYDIWDGYIKFNFTKFDSLGNPFEPVVLGGGDVLRVKDLGTGAEADVVFYIRDGLNGVIFVKNTTGTFSLGNDFGDNVEIEFIGDAGRANPVYQPNRVFGQIDAVGFSYAPFGIGKFLVFQNSSNIALPAQSILLESEYWFYDEAQVSGIPRQPNLPGPDSNDWEEVFSIPVDQDAENNLSERLYEGMFSIFERRPSGNYDPVGYYINEYRASNQYLGTTVKGAKNNDLYRLFVYASQDGNNGKIYQYKKGTENNVTFDWDTAKNKKFKGEFDSAKTYKENDIVYVGGALLVAKTNLAAGTFNNSDWTSTNDLVDYVGYLPNDTTLSVINDSTDGSTVLDQEAIGVFGNNIDTSSNGDVLTVSVTYNEDKPNGVVIYRINNGFFEFDQLIEAPNKTIGFADSLSISDDGMSIAIGAPYDDQIDADQGIVYIYKQVDGKFVLDQKLYSPKNERAEQFGTALSYTGNVLAVGSKNADSIFESTIDVFSKKKEGSTYINDPTSRPSGSPTTFDNSFTRFRKTNVDDGVVYVYESQNGKLIYADIIQLNNANVDYFGRNVEARQNHVYVGLPRLETDGKLGAVVDYRIVGSVYDNIRTPKDPVDVSKIKKVVLYNTKTKKLLAYLDYIDVLQGKIAGVAEQELRYKTYYDPATYTTGTDVVVDKFNTWGTENVGQLWWDLTNAKFLNPYQNDVTYSTNNWNKLFAGASIDVYEWIETTLTPEQWNAQADTNDGLAQGISGQAKTLTNYVLKKVYDSISQTFVDKYFYWVKDKKTIPNNEFRNESAFNTAQLIADPYSYGYKFVSFFANNQFAINNCDTLIEGKDVAISIQYYTLDNQDTNIHNQYQILTDGLASSKPNRDIERKWFDSLIGYDTRNRPVPDVTLGPKKQYGILNNPRQSIFVNSTEALKQTIERINGVLIKNLIVENKNLTGLEYKEDFPSTISRLYDTEVDTFAEIELIGVAKSKQAILTPVILNGKITRVIITDPGRGYLVAPTYKILGESGQGADFTLSIDNAGQITSVTVNNEGENYEDSTTIEVRKFSALVKTDETINGKWSIYERLSETSTWSRIKSQAYNTTLYWEYADWYDTGISETTGINYLIDFSYQLDSLNDSIGDVVKISTIGSGGWLLLQKIDNQITTDYTVNYKTIGRQNGTIQFKRGLYDVTANLNGFDSISFDVQFYDAQPTVEQRRILEVIRDDIFTVELEEEYNKLFFASIRYAFSEQPYIDWAFKTSFVKAQHNVGTLREDITFNNDNLPSYEDYLEEVKPFKTKLREYLSSYEKIEPTNTVITDFDLSPRYVEGRGIQPHPSQVLQDMIVGTESDITTYPYRHWLDNASYEIKSVNIYDGGSRYSEPPLITAVGGGGTGAKFKSYLGINGKIVKIEVVNGGSGYISAPTLDINGSNPDGVDARISAVIGHETVRSFLTKVKFDRISSSFIITKLNEVENFVGTGSKYIFDLKWPIDVQPANVKVSVGGIELLSSEYTYTNLQDNTKTYVRFKGQITIDKPPANTKAIVIEYKKDPELLVAQDRVNLLYDPTTGMLGKDIAQVIDGIDYGGVEVKSFGFENQGGFDAEGWFTGKWDTYDDTYEDEVFNFDGSTNIIEVSKALENGVEYNVYKNNVRIDDPNYDGSTIIENKNATMETLVGDGTTKILYIDNFGINVGDGDTLVIRKKTSDGSFLADPGGYDTVIEGGDFPYSSASGLLAEDINVDGDGFVTPTTSKGPEEIIPGQVLDTVDIQVFERPTGGSSNIRSFNYIGDGSTKTFAISENIAFNNNLFLKVGNVIKTQNDYKFSVDRKSIILNVAPTANTRVNIITLDVSGQNVLDYGTFVGDGSTIDYLTNVRWTDNMTHYATIDGVEQDTLLIKSDDSAYDVPGNVVIRFATPIANDKIINFGIFEGTRQNYSAVQIDTFIGDGSSLTYTLEKTPFSATPSQHNTIVKVNNTILTAGYSQHFAVSDVREYRLDLWQVPLGTFNHQDLLVYLNDIELTFGEQWNFVSAGEFDSSLRDENDEIILDQQIGSTVTLLPGVGKTGDTLRVYAIKDGQYAYGYWDSAGDFISTPGTIYMDNVYDTSDTITVYTFTNDSSQGIERQEFDVVERTKLTQGTSSWYNLRQLRNGLIELRKPATDAQYVWIAKNGILLTPSVDYFVTDNKKYVKIAYDLAENDTIDIIHFAEPPLIQKFGWRQFKDILNRTHYKRLTGEENILLVKDLYPWDKTIEVENGDRLPQPGANPDMPSIIFIEGERIEYFVRDGNTLKQLRRATLGTGSKSVYKEGTEVYHQGIDQNIPYKDETITLTLDGDGTSTQFQLDWTPNSVNEFEVFVAGKRMRKNSIDRYQFETVDGNGNTVSAPQMDSPEGDETLPPEYTVSGTTLTLADAAPENSKIIIIRKQGRTWSDPGTPISKATGNIARFLRNSTTDLPR
tara:strand:+ start:3398 stop:18538 length:15141 start_codon:yes stop_codon:yes gene_type:complete